MATTFPLIQDELKKIFQDYIQNLNLDYKFVYVDRNSFGYELDMAQRTERVRKFEAALRTTVTAADAPVTWTIDKGNSTTRYLGADILLHVLPLSVLQVMSSFPESKFDISLLTHCYSAIYPSMTGINQKIINLPEFFETVSFLCSRKEIQEKLTTLPTEESLDQKARESTFTQEKFAKILFICRDLGSEQGRTIFETHQDKIQVTTSLLNSVISPCFSDETFEWCRLKWAAVNPKGELPKDTLDTLFEAYFSVIQNKLLYQLPSPKSGETPEQMVVKICEEPLKRFQKELSRMVAVNKQVIWKKPDTYSSAWHISLFSGEKFFIPNVIPLEGLQTMASLNPDTFDVSLLGYYRDALECYKLNQNVFKDKNILNLENILDSIEFLLNQKNMQQQIKCLLTTDVLSATNRYYAFSQEKFNQLLFLCEGTNLKKGAEIFEQNKEKMQIVVKANNNGNTTPVIPYITSDNLIQWYFTKWVSQNPNQEFPATQFFFEALNQYIRTVDKNNSLAMPMRQEQLQEATAIFKRYLEMICRCDKSKIWEVKLTYPPIWHVESQGNILLCGVIPLAGLKVMASSLRKSIDVSLLEYYRVALEYYLKNSSKMQGKTVENLPDILASIEFVLSQKEIQDKLPTLPQAKSSQYHSHFTHDKFTELLFLCLEVGMEQGINIFNQHEKRIKISGSVLALLVSQPSYSQALKTCVQRLAGKVPEGTIGALAYRYTEERYSILTGTQSSEDEKLQKEEEAFQNFEKTLSKVVSFSETPIVCTKEDFPEGIGLVTSDADQVNCYIVNLLPMKAITLMQDTFKIQLNPALCLSYLHKLLCLDETTDDDDHELPKNIKNRDELIEALQFFMRDQTLKQNMLPGLKTSQDFLKGLVAAIVLQAPELYEPLYPKFCLHIQKKTSAVQEYELDYIACVANKHKAIELIKLLSTHPAAKITPKFLKIAAEADYYDGLRCMLTQRPEFLEKLSITNKMLNNPQLLQIFEERLKKETEKHELNEKEVKEIQEMLVKIPDIYVEDMTSTVIRIAQHKRLLTHHSVEEIIALEFGSFLPIWNQKSVQHPAEANLVKNSESLLGSFYGYKPELYQFLTIKLRNMIPYNLGLSHKRFCFNLAVLFPNEEEVDNYFLLLKAKQNKDNTLDRIILDAANFKIPKKGYWDIQAWFNFVKRHNFSQRAMAFLRAASDIDMKTRLGNTIYAMYRKQEAPSIGAVIEPKNDYAQGILKGLMKQFKYDKKALWESLKKQCPLAYAKLIEQFMPKKLQQQRALQRQKKHQGLSFMTETELLVYVKEEIEHELTDRGDKLNLLVRNIVKTFDVCHEEFSLDSLLALRMQDLPQIPEAYKEAVVTAVENGYSNEDISNLIKHIEKQKQMLTFVPSIVVDGSEIQDGDGRTYSKYELKPLEKTDPMALVAGLKTRCCQHFRDAGMESAMHAYSSPYGITYRLAAKKDPNVGDWLAQSWTVLSECGTIVLFDSIEYAGHANEKMVLDAFKKAAIKLLEKNPHLKEVWVGDSQHARLKLENYGYTRKPRGENFNIGGYSEDSYTDAEEVVVLMDRNALKNSLEDKELKTTQEETKLESEYQLRYGIDTYLEPEKSKVIKQPGLSDLARQAFKTQHASTIALLMEEPDNPLVEEGFVSSNHEKDSRYREGEWYITFKVAKLWLDRVFNPEIKSRQLAHEVYAVKKMHVSRGLEEARNNTSIKTFTLIVFIDIHAVSMFVNPKKGVCFILDSEPGNGLDDLINACESYFPGMRVITPGNDLRLQKDFYSCITFALKSARYYAKHADAFSQLLARNKTGTLELTEMPPALLKMTQTSLEGELTEAQKNTVVSSNNNLILTQYWAKHRLPGTPFNTAALKTRQKILEDITDESKPRKYIVRYHV